MTRAEVVDYVLHRPDKHDEHAIEEALQRACDVWPLIAEGNIEAAMLKLHTKPAIAERITDQKDTK